MGNVANMDLKEDLPTFNGVWRNFDPQAGPWEEEFLAGRS